MLSSPDDDRKPAAPPVASPETDAARIARDPALNNPPSAPFLAPSPVLDNRAPSDESLSQKARLKILLAMFVAELLPIAGFVIWVFVESDAADVQPRLLSLLAAFAFLTIQAGILAPVTKPRAGLAPAKSPWYWLSAIALGLVAGLVVVSAIFLAADFYWATHADFTDSQRDQFVIGGLIMALLSWLLSIPLIMAFMKRRRSDSALARVSAALFLGTAVEVIASIPVFELAKRRESCVCSLASFWAIFLSSATGFIVLGPMIFLVIVSRRTRAASRGLCPVCGADLRPLPNRDRCPHCGTGWKVPAS